MVANTRMASATRTFNTLFMACERAVAAKAGVYRLGTKTVEMPGGMEEVKTIGPDNKLRLVVTVA